MQKTSIGATSNETKGRGRSEKLNRYISTTPILEMSLEIINAAQTKTAMVRLQVLRSVRIGREWLRVCRWL